MRQLAYGLIVFVASPFIVVGYLVLLLRSARKMRREKVSATAVNPLYRRALLHRLGRRPDPVAAALLPRVPFMSPAGLALLTVPLYWATRLTGWYPRFLRYDINAGETFAGLIAARTAFFDAAITRHRPRVRQLLILGAGFDTRSFTHSRGLPVFEVDLPRIQALKRRLLLESGWRRDDIVFAPADFKEARWLDALTARGFNPALPTFVLWEGVSYYLPAPAVVETLRAVASLGPGTVLAFDYLARRLAERPTRSGRLMHRLSGLNGEAFRFGLLTRAPAQAHAAAFVRQYGLRLEDYRPLGAEAHTREPLGGLVVAVRDAQRAGAEPPAA